jgi:hypothetical protein
MSCGKEMCNIFQSAAGKEMADEFSFSKIFCSVLVHDKELASIASM